MSPNTSHLSSDVREELLKVLFGQFPLIVAGNLFLAAANLYTYRDRLELSALVLFGSAVVALTAVRMVMYGNFHLSGYRFLSINQYSRLIKGFSLVNGLIWGSWSWYVLTMLGPYDSLAMIIIQAGICAGTVSTSSATRLGLYLFVIPALLPISIYQWGLDTREGDVLAVGFFMYLLMVIVSSRRVYRTICETVILAQQNRQLAEDLYRFSNTDGLTGIANRRFFDTSLNTHWERANKNDHSLALLLIDVDFFKSYNDSKGHVQGDECLRRVASLIRDFFHGQDAVVARYGGEEFVVLLPATDDEAALLQAEALRCGIERHGIPHEQSLPWGRVTISIGYAACVPSPQCQALTLLELADRALYQAKKNGRNRVCGRDDLIDPVGAVTTAALVRALT